MRKILLKILNAVPRKRHVQLQLRYNSLVRDYTKLRRQYEELISYHTRALIKQSHYTLMDVSAQAILHEDIPILQQEKLLCDKILSQLLLLRGAIQLEESSDMYDDNYKVIKASLKVALRED